MLLGVRAKPIMATRVDRRQASAILHHDTLKAVFCMGKVGAQTFNAFRIHAVIAATIPQESLNLGFANFSPAMSVIIEIMV